jgi:hypothetical protein
MNMNGKDSVIGMKLNNTRGTLGLGFMIEKFEIYGRVTPRLSLVDNTAFDLGAGAGFRFYF